MVAVTGEGRHIHWEIPVVITGGLGDNQLEFFLEGQPSNVGRYFQF